MGNIEQLAAMIPGLKPGALKDAKMDDKLMARSEAIILSMTEDEREHPNILNGSRRKRIARGSGCSVEEVNKLIRQYDMINNIMKQFSGGKMSKAMKRMNIPFNMM